MTSRFFAVLCLALTWPVVRGEAATALQPDAISFNQHIRPILSDNCFKCHGADENSRKAKLRLDDPAAALLPAKSGDRAIVPGKSDASELIKRILTDDEDDVMPPPATKKVLTAEQKKLLRAWVDAGAKYETHWSFVPPAPVAAPAVKSGSAVRNPIDNFILARLEKEGLKPSAPADRHTLVRRVYLDLLGLPPTPEEADVFVNDKSPEAFDRLLDRLFASPHYGERWARRWLDLARYADTNGYEKDRPRSIWAYRDWVIQALDADMPFDEFTIKQLAGDLLPDATLEDRIATGFHRNTMLNEEGGTDPLEYRYLAVVDRVNTTSTAWLGLTVGCAQCHTHKYDPITHREYFGLMAFLNNTEEPQISVPDLKIAAKRVEQENEIAALERKLADKFPVEQIEWKRPQHGATISSGGAVEKQADESWRFTGADKDTYTFSFTNEAPREIRSLRIEALVDETLPAKGVGLSGGSANFVLSELQLMEVSADGATTNILKLVKAKADFSQDEFNVTKAIDGDSKTGWAVNPQGTKNHWATFELEKPLQAKEGTRLEVRMDQQYGNRHVMARARCSFGVQVPDERPIEVRRKELIEQRYAKWEKEESTRAINWTVLTPVAAKSNEPIMTILDDGSVLASGDQTKSDSYDVRFRAPGKKITAIRLEALPHESLPGNGPGRVYYEGTPGDFLLCEFKVTANDKQVTFKRASESFTPNPAGNNRIAAELTYDGDMLSGWSTRGEEGKAHAAVYVLSEPIDGNHELNVKMFFERYYASDLGRFRISVTSSDQVAEARGLTAEIESIAAKSSADRSAAEKERLFAHFLNVVPELADARAELKKRRDALPKAPTTLVMAERPPEHARKTRRHDRGEFLQPKEEVPPLVPAFLPGLPADKSLNRLTFAQWLVATNNPLTARVTVNRQWQAFFGEGLVSTLDDFGFQGKSPSHPELLDWLAVEFMKQGWSMKKLHRLIVSSATYQQSSASRPELIERDPENILLARGARVRVDAETIRDLALKSSGLLTAKLGGPSVFPPQPASVTTEGAYGPLTWKTSTGEDRYRRSLYTYAKRTAPFAMFGTFDGPTGEACVARREVSNTPLQALALLNDIILVEAAQALGKTFAEDSAVVETKLETLFRRCITRPPSDEERTMLTAYYQKQKQRLEAKELDAEKISGAKENASTDRAAWTLVARAVLNLDEAITKE